jgi:hypothetical protein
MTNPVRGDDNWLTPLAAETRVYELFNIMDLATAGHKRVVTFTQLIALLEGLSTGKYDIPHWSYQRPSPSSATPRRRLVQHSQSIYRKDDLTGPLPLGRLESMALPYKNFQLAFSKQHIEDIYVADGKLSEAEVLKVLCDIGKYIQYPDGSWWVPTGELFFSPNRDHTPEEELAWARAHFFLPHRARDVFSSNYHPIESLVSYDQYDLLVQETCDSLWQQDYCWGAGC